MTTYAYFAQNFALPLLAGLAVLILGTVKHWSWKKRGFIVLLVILSALAISLSATWEHRPGRSPVVAGTVVDDVSGDAISGATVRLADGSQSYVSEDNGNFRLDLSGKAKEFERVRIHITKAGYSSYDGSVQVSAENFVVRLHHL